MSMIFNHQHSTSSDCQHRLIRGPNRNVNSLPFANIPRKGRQVGSSIRIYQINRSRCQIHSIQIVLLRFLQQQWLPFFSECPSVAAMHFLSSFNSESTLGYRDTVRFVILIRGSRQVSGTSKCSLSISTGPNNVRSTNHVISLRGLEEPILLCGRGA